MQRGSVHRVMAPLQVPARLAALIPPPRHPLIRCYGVFAPHAFRRSCPIAVRRSEAVAPVVARSLSSLRAADLPLTRARACPGRASLKHC